MRAYHPLPVAILAILAVSTPSASGLTAPCERSTTADDKISGSFYSAIYESQSEKLHDKKWKFVYCVKNTDAVRPIKFEWQKKSGIDYINDFILPGEELGQFQESVCNSMTDLRLIIYNNAVSDRRYTIHSSCEQPTSPEQTAVLNASADLHIPRSQNIVEAISKGDYTYEEEDFTTISFRVESSYSKETSEVTNSLTYGAVSTEGFQKWEARNLVEYPLFLSGNLSVFNMSEKTRVGPEPKKQTLNAIKSGDEGIVEFEGQVEILDEGGRVLATMRFNYFGENQ